MSDTKLYKKIEEESTRFALKWHAASFGIMGTISIVLLMLGVGSWIDWLAIVIFSAFIVYSVRKLRKI